MLHPHDHWGNWSGYQRTATTLKYPPNIEALQSIVSQAKHCRIVGAGHSFSPLVPCQDTIISLDALSGIIQVDEQQQLSTVWGGTRIETLGKQLFRHHQALLNQGDINQQSIAGAVSTATHGTGINLSCLSAHIHAFELMLADGQRITCSTTEHSDIYAAGRVSLGCLGVLTQLTLQTRPYYKLTEHIRLEKLSDIMQNMDHWKTQHRHIECLAFVHCDYAIIKTLDESTNDITATKTAWPSDDQLLKWLSELVRQFPFVNTYIQKTLRLLVSSSSRTNWSHHIFPSPRTTKFNEMEYQVPASDGLKCLDETLWTIRQSKLPVFFPLEYRYVQADDCWLSPFYQQDCASISVHQYHKQDPWPVFLLAEPIFRRYLGRPHWGKLHSMDIHGLSQCYPKWQDFITMRKQLDPNGKFLNRYLEWLFGERTT